MNSSNISECQSGCSHCSADSSIDTAAGEGIFTGWRLVSAVLWVFVLPLGLAVTAALFARFFWPGPARMLLAALAGLTAGGAISRVATGLIGTTPANIDNDRKET
ncbi:MAG: hypothetical protein ISS69_05790 [Phycisphaerae bacterium]|nr:hypothetical protein [Planctomycetota bacterium]MBL7219603.1 hypothetical protein [Phycisphaerae bacterium]